MKEVADDIGNRISSIANFEPTLQDLKREIKKRKNWSSPGVDGIQNFWWKKFPSIHENLVGTMRKWCIRLEEMLNIIPVGKTFLIPKTNRLDLPSEYRPITCLNTIYKVFTGLIAGYLKDHLMTNEIWDQEQTGAREKVLGTIDQLLIDQCIMEEVREHKRNLAVAYYDYKKAYDFVQHDWLIRVLDWMKVPEQVIKLLSVIIRKWKTKLILFDKGKFIESRWIHFKRGLLQGDSLSPIAFF